MNKRLYIFQIVGKIFTLAIMLLCVPMNLYAQSIFWQGMNIACKAFGVTAFCWSVIIYCITVLRVAKFAQIKKYKLVISVLAEAFAFVALMFLGANSHIFTFFIAISAILYFLFGINKMDISLYSICKKSDETE